MDKKISELNELLQPVSADEFAVVHDGETMKVTLENLQAQVNKPLGWGRYDDNQWTVTNPLPLVDGNRVILTNNASTVEAYGSFSFFDSAAQRVVAENVNDTYIITVVFKAKAPNANQTHLDLTLYSPVGGYERLAQSLVFAKGNDVEENFHTVFQYYADSDLVTNGLEVQITADGGNASVYDVIFFVQRTQNNG